MSARTGKLDRGAKAMILDPFGFKAMWQTRLKCGFGQKVSAYHIFVL